MSEIIYDPDGSILNDVKHTLGVHETYTEFDPDIIMHTNSAFFELHMIGVGPSEPFRITGANEAWTDFLGTRRDLEVAKSFVYVAVRLVFDRPETSYGIQALEKMKDRWAWMLEVQRQREPS